MKTTRIKVALVGIVAVLVIAWFVRNNFPHRPTPVVTPPTPQESKVALNEAERPKKQRPLIRNPFNMKFAGAFTNEEKQELADKFATKLKPAADKWFRAYGNHVPFNVADLTLDKFVSRMGKDSSYYLYTFVLSDVTFVIQESGDGAKVSYLMSRRAAQAMNMLPTSGAPPDLTTTVNQADIVGMVQADTGVQFKPNEIIIHPTAAATAMSGGEFVQVIPNGADPNNALNAKVDMVFNADGKIVNYDRDPFF